MDFPKKANIKYSLKNIPIPHQDTYLKRLIDQVEKVLQRIRWKTFFFLNPQNKDKPQPERYGFKTPHNAPQSRELVNFEADVTHLIANLEFRDTKCSFQKQLKKDVNYIKKSDKVFVKADKTSNVYEVSKNKYHDYVRDNVTAHYKKTEPEIEVSINKEARMITQQLDISDRVEPIAHQEAYVTIKDHKEGFPNNVKCRLINPAKSNIGKISKILLQNINNTLRLSHQLKQWRSTGEALDWYKSLKNKTSLTFLQLDIVDFYPSISAELFSRALDFANETVHISNDDKQILTNARKSLLFSNGCTWSKQSGLHDVTMGSYDGCEVCELVGLFILKTTRDRFPELNFGLYRDDGLGAHQKLPGPKLERMKKDLVATFKDLGLSITIETQLHTVNFLDVTFNLNDESYAPYRKPNDTPLYIHVKSNHPKSVINQVPLSVEKRLNDISSTKEIFENAKEEYEDALKASGHNVKLKYFAKNTTVQTAPKKRRKRRNDVVWFNPPFNKNVKTNVGGQFLKLVDKNFPTNNPLSKIINRTTVKMSYSCTENIGQIIQNKNKKLLSNVKATAEKECNCRDKAKCPVENKCLTEAVVYKAKIDSAEYVGITENSFKTRFNLHTSTFRNANKKSATTLAAHVWNKGLNPDPKVEWTILQRCSKYQPGHKTCNLCLSEKLHIIKNCNKAGSLNKRSDIGNKCTFHRKKHFLDHIT